MIIRSSSVNISYANDIKLRKLDDVFVESKHVINSYIDMLWTLKDFHSKFVTFNVDTWLSARMQQALGKQALEIVKSQRRKRKKTKPVFDKDVINLDSRFVNIRYDDNHFDIWVKLTSLGNKLKLNLPGHKHVHFNKFMQDGYIIKNSVRIKKNPNGKYFIEFIFEKEEPVPLPAKAGCKAIGYDTGYRTLLADSNGGKHGTDMMGIYDKIARREPGSKGRRRAIRERDNKINEIINGLDLSNVSTIVVEDLKDVKRGTGKASASLGKKRFRKSFNNKLSRWSYPKVLNKINRVCELRGIDFIKVNPAYTSQTCSKCGFIHEDNRNMGDFACMSCDMEMDADVNAAINILHRGIYSFSAGKG